MKNKIIVSIVMGSDSDLPVMKDAVNVFTEFNIPHEIMSLKKELWGRREYP